MTAMSSAARKIGPAKKGATKIRVTEAGTAGASAKQLAARKRLVAEHEVAHGKIPRARVLAVKAEWQD